MIPVIMMIVGGILILLSLIGLIQFVFEPFQRTYRIVIKRADDYAHYTSPRNFAMLQKARRTYLTGILVMFVTGFILSYAGAFLQFGERGFGFLFSTKALERASDTDSDVTGELENRIDENGNYTDPSGNSYSNFIVVKGHVVAFKEQEFKDMGEFRSFIGDIGDMGTVYIVDDYAASSTYKEVMDMLEEYGFDYEPK
ncbi:MAG: hypothetical protein II966_00215 [Lachnospiraceae bacterium]|nr:hypothetical protein [Lachnospiraceae bacterium]